MLTVFALTCKVSAQDTPEYDKIATAAGNVELYFIGHGSLMFRVNGYTIHIDPVKSAGDYRFRPKADLILITHDHGDHLDIPLINELKKAETVVLTNEKTTEQLGWASPMSVGSRQEINNIVIEAVHAYNIVNMRSPGNPYHPKGVGVGYVITIGGVRIYVAGDTENIPEMEELKDIDVAFLPMNLPNTMTPAMVADAAKKIMPAILYPYHYGNTDTGEIVELLKNSGIEVRIRNLK
ncbi:MAG: MBL fold metallo-hydrolase [Bacteroidales bacterium]|nr:MBL fold metallo-hydrolase [Bacteroidales bacterium]